MHESHGFMSLQVKATHFFQELEDQINCLGHNPFDPSVRHFQMYIYIYELSQRIKQIDEVDTKGSEMFEGTRVYGTRC